MQPAVRLLTLKILPIKLDPTQAKKKKEEEPNSTIDQQKTNQKYWVEFSLSC